MSLKKIERKGRYILSEGNRYSLSNFFSDGTTEFVGFTDLPEILEEEEPVIESIQTGRYKIRYDSIATKYFKGRDELWWFILEYNNIINPFNPGVTELEIPSYETFLQFMEKGRKQ